MGIWDYISLTSDSVKRNSPDLTALKGWCSSSYGQSWTVVAKIDNAIRMKLNQSMPDEEARSKISQFATNFAKNAIVHAFHEGLKIIPGGTLVDKIVSRSLHHGKKVDGNEGEIKALQDKKGKMEEDIMERKKVIERAEMEELQEDMNKAKQRNKISAKSISGSEPLKKIQNEASKELHPPKMDKKRVFIRSRL